MPTSPDVLVVGSGVFGLASAWELAQNGHSVTVLDRAPVGTEASGWALGRLDPLLKGSGSTGETEKDAPAGQLGRPEDQKKLSLLSYAAHKELTREIEELSGTDIQVDDQPTLQLFYSEAEQNFAREYAADWTAQGFQTDLVTADEIKAKDTRIGATELGGAVVQGPYFIDSMRFVQALAACARSAGVKLETATVNSLETASDDAVTVHTDQGHYSAGKVVVAAGPWTPQLVDQFDVKLPVHPSKGEIIRLTPPAGAEFGAHLHGPCSLVIKKDGFAWVAATAANVGFDKSPTEESRTTLVSHARKMLSDTAKWPVAMQTVCFRPATPDDMPVLGTIAENVLVATGGGGGGIMHCLYVGRQVAKMVSQGEAEPDMAAVSLTRFNR